MAAHEKDDATGFLSRWSQRKRAAEQDLAQPPVPDDAEADQSPAASGQPEADSGPIDPAELPDIDSLQAGSDFTAFMREGVPSALRRGALRRLWQVDPAFRHLCMLDDYNLDYTDAATVVPNLKTIYQVGRGMILPGEDDAKQAQAGGDAPAKLAAPETAAGLPGAGEAVPAAPATPEAAPPETTGPAAAAGTASEPAPADPAEETATPPLKPRIPGPPRAAGGATPARLESGASGDGATRSARQRRWGDADA